MAADARVVEAAAAAARDVLFSRLDRHQVEDLDVSVSFDGDDLSVEVYVLAPAADVDVAQVADDAALAARGAADGALRDEEQEHAERDDGE